MADLFPPGICFRGDNEKSGRRIAKLLDAVGGEAGCGALVAPAKAM